MAQTLTITLTDEGQVTCSGPLTEKILCYGLLEVARDIVSQQGTQTRVVVPAQGLLVPRN